MRKRRGAGVDWVAALQRLATLARSIRGDALEDIAADHATELQRGSRVQELLCRVDRTFTTKKDKPT